MSTEFQSCPNCECFILSDTYECPECGHVFDEGRARQAKTDRNVATKSMEMYDTCQKCGEAVRTGLVRCWNCNNFMRADVEARYKEMTATPQHIIFSEIPKELRTELMPLRDRDGRLHGVNVFDADDDDDGGFSLQDSTPASGGQEDDAGFELNVGSQPAAQQQPPPESKAAPSSEEPADESGGQKPSETAARETHDNKAAGEKKPPGELDVDDLVGIAMQDQRETRLRKRQKLQEAKKQRILMPCACGAWIRVHQDQAGKAVRCRQCKTPVIVPVMKKKEKDAPRKKGASIRVDLTWLPDVRLHIIQPTEVVLKPGSLEKTFENVDVVFHDSGMFLIRYAPPAKKSLFSRSTDGPPAVEDQRQQAEEKIRKSGKFDSIPFGEVQCIPPDQISTVRLIQPVAEAHASMFAGVPVFGDGQIAIYLPLQLPDNQQAFCSFPLTLGRRIFGQLSSRFQLNLQTAENGIPAAEEFTTLKCHFSEMPVRSLKNVVYYQNDPAYEVEVAGHICGTCGIALSEEARAKKKFGGAAGKGIAKAKCPKCSNKFGDQKAWNLTKTPDEENADEEEDVSEVLKPKSPGPADPPATQEDPISARLQGSWKMISLGRDGAFDKPDDVSGAEIVFRIEGENYSVSAGGNSVEEGTLLVDEKQSPPHLDQKVSSGPDAGKSHLGIVRFTDDRLEHCQGGIDQPRPSGFESENAAGASLAIFERTT